MFKHIKTKVSGAPTPMGGLALGIASLGWAWESMANLNGVAQYTGAAIASVLLLLLTLKFLLHPQLLKADLAHPVVGSVVPTSDIFSTRGALCWHADVCSYVAYDDLPDHFCCAHS